MPTSSSFEPLLRRMQELRDLSGVIGLCTWDQETHLPKKAEAARGTQLSALQGLYHERLTSQPLGDALGAAAQDASLDPDQRAMVRVLTWERERAVKVPTSLVRELAEAQSAGLAAWREAREAKHFAPFQPALARLLGLRRAQADALGHHGCRYDALLDAYEPGMTVARLKPVLGALKEKLLPLVGRLAGEGGAGGIRPSRLAGKRFGAEKQWLFTLDLLEAMGFDFEAGRQDRSVHPFTGGTHPLDVRLTTRIHETNLLSGIFSSIHEGGHGLYEQGFSPAHHRTPLAQAPSMGLHESQSRLWENVVGRSRAFWEHFYPRLREHFATELSDVPLEAFHAEMNEVRRTLIRTDADEVTYNLHIILRFELELLLVDDQLPLADLPGVWNERMEASLGVRPGNDLEGVLQDIHWAWGELGYFPTYALGNLYAASLIRAAEQQLPELWRQISSGKLAPLRDWLRRHIHQEGYREPAEALVTRVTGAGLTDADFITYLTGKYG